MDISEGYKVLWFGSEVGIYLLFFEDNMSYIRYVNVNVSLDYKWNNLVWITDVCVLYEGVKPVRLYGYTSIEVGMFWPNRLPEVAELEDPLLNSARLPVWVCHDS